MTVLADMMSYIFAQAILVVFLLCFDLRIGLAALVIIGVVLLIARGMKREALQDSVARQEQNENLTEAVLDFVEGIGIIKTYNMLGEKSRELTDNFQRSCDTNLQFEESHSPWQLRLNLAYGLGAAVIAAIALALESAGLMSVPYLVGIMLFVFDLFGPIKALYTQATRLTVMNSCMDRIEEVFHEPELPDDGRGREIHHRQPAHPFLGRERRPGAGPGEGRAGGETGRPDGPHQHGVPAGLSLPGHHL